MNKLVCSALAASVVGATGFAGTGTDSWASLDRELDSLSATLSAQSGGPQVGGWIISSFDYEEDGIAVDEDVTGFRLRTARINVSGNVGDYGYKLSYDFGSEDLSADPTGDVRDAYATFKLGDAVTGRMGNFKPPTLSSHLIERNRLLFLDRTSIAEGLGTFGNSGRDLGLMLSGDFETVGWWLSIQNGEDGVADEHRFTARVAVDLLDDGVGAVEGAYGAPDGTALTLAAFWQDDGTFEDGTMIGAEARMTAGPFAAAAEMIDLDDDIATFFGSETPWDATLSYLFTEQYEAAIRWEDFDDTAETTRIALGVNRYVQGHDIKWTLQVATFDSDDEALETDSVSLGLAVTF